MIFWYDGLGYDIVVCWLSVRFVCFLGFPFGGFAVCIYLIAFVGFGVLV